MPADWIKPREARALGVAPGALPRLAADGLVAKRGGRYRRDDAIAWVVATLRRVVDGRGARGVQWRKTFAMAATAAGSRAHEPAEVLRAYVTRFGVPATPDLARVPTADAAAVARRLRAAMAAADPAALRALAAAAGPGMTPQGVCRRLERCAAGTEAQPPRAAVVDALSEALGLPRAHLRLGADPGAPAVQPTDEGETMEPTSKYVIVTPAMAARWLEKNPKNRHVVEAKIDKYAQMMREGRWLPNNQGIGIDADGNLLDGQHRLRAVIKAGVAVKMLVTTGLVPEARWTVDTGAPRRLAHVISMLDGEPHVNNVASWGAMHLRLTGRSNDMSYPQYKEWRAANAEAVEFVRDNFLCSTDGGVRGVMRTAPVCGSLVFAYPTNPAKIREFAVQLRSGEGLVRGMPAHTLRMFFQSIGEYDKGASGSLARAKKTLSAAMAHCLGESLARMVVGDRGHAYFARRHGYVLDVDVRPHRAAVESGKQLRLVGT